LLLRKAGGIADFWIDAAKADIAIGPYWPSKNVS